VFISPLWATAVLAVDFVVLYGVLAQSDEFLTVLTPQAGKRRAPGAPAVRGPTCGTG
jgi:hypothetical protein